MIWSLSQISQQIFCKSRKFTQLASEKLQWVSLGALCTYNWLGHVMLELTRKPQGHPSSLLHFLYFCGEKTEDKVGIWPISSEVSRWERLTALLSNDCSWAWTLGSCLHKLPSTKLPRKRHELLEPEGTTTLCAVTRPQDTWQNLTPQSPLPQRPSNAQRDHSCFCQDNTSVSLWM